MAMFTLSPSGLLNNHSVDFSIYRGVDPTFLSRYILQASILKAYQLHQGIDKLKILDVGGSGSIIEQFIDVDLTIIDILPNVAKTRNYVQGSALSMPFADSQFDAIISCDVLEHIPKDDRPAFLKESARVSKDLVIVAAPFNLKGVRDAEIEANEYYKKMTGVDHRWLLEHLLDELPGLQKARLVLEKAGLNSSHFSHTSLDNWQLVTRAGFLLAQKDIYPEFTDNMEELIKYYLKEIMPHDFSKFGYRSFLIASKKHEIDIKSEPDVYQPQLTAIYTMLTNSILSLL